nr:hypothetical protein [Tanacetum cinerariifolium]
MARLKGSGLAGVSGGGVMGVVGEVEKQQECGDKGLWDRGNGIPYKLLHRDSRTKIQELLWEHAAERR